MSLTLHALARTTPRVRAELKAAPASISHAELATQYGLSLDTVRKWRMRDSTVRWVVRTRRRVCTPL